ncbi:hypothetical protein OG863_21445 [Streptomyces decoyicus]|uniref:Uncharacterized protein n=1 Tax=Streptomyces decoyicus TaxID=249567 RepID=A0ABZ1FIR0_9ACTN|nr:hypothetical protein [Streptomyces decoyicus]WSB70317.1 hypothetical protein OG863_21445 [Streptomyces decoyicus]
MTGMPVLYRPTDLAALTDGSGAVADRSLSELSGLKAGDHFKAADGSYPYRAHPAPIPTLQVALDAIPRGKQIYLDLKQAPAGHVVEAGTRVLDENKARGRAGFEVKRQMTLQEKFSAAFESYGRLGRVCGGREPLANPGQGKVRCELGFGEPPRHHGSDRPPPTPPTRCATPLTTPHSKRPAHAPTPPPEDSAPPRTPAAHSAAGP